MSEKKRPIIRDGVTFWHCPKCEQDKLEEEFHKCRSTSNRLYNYCKVCQCRIVKHAYARKWAGK